MSKSSGTIFVRVAQEDDGGLIIKASPRVNYEAISTRRGNSKHVHATTMFALTFDVPDEIFRQAEKVLATINVDSEQVKICSKVSVPE